MSDEFPLAAPPPTEPAHDPGAPAPPALDALRVLRHELRSPLNHVIGYAELLLEGAAEQGLQALAPALEAIRADGVRALRLVNELFAPDAPGASAPDTGGLREALVAVLDQITRGTAALQQQAAALGQDDAVLDLQRIDRAASHLRALLHERLPLAAPDMLPAGAATPVAPRTPGAAPLPAAPRLPSSPLPAASPAEAHAAPDGSPAPGAAGALLVVDDNALNRDMLARRLERLGYGVTLAENGRQALALLRAQPVDLVLLDVMMPEMDGYEVLAVRQQDPRLRDVPVIMLSALDELDSVVRCIAMGAEDYLPKPFDPVLLRARIGACLEKKRLHDQEKAYLAIIEAQAAELAAWNRTLEARVQQQVDELERVGRLRRFLSPQVAEVIVAAGDERLLQSHRREITVVFADLRGFTAFAATASPEAVMGVLHEYHAAMGALIFEHEGTLEHFAGDGLMVFFNDPLPCPDPPARAVRMAVAMRARVAALAEDWRRRGHALGFGVGIAVGEATLGRIGFEGRFDYGAIGPVTNLASRFCDQAATGQILISDRVHAAVAALAVTAPLGPLPLKGFPAPIPAYNVLRLR
ncbi:MAG TPA: response regulator [Chloroflexota bacterium]|nr:response regulator [Chloroflexota bacterium]